MFCAGLHDALPGSSHIQQTYHGACSLKSAVQGCGWWLDQSEFRTMAEAYFRVLFNPANAKKKTRYLCYQGIIKVKY